MTAAFDKIDINQLLNIIATIVNEDELRILRFLLSNTKINTRINGATKTMSGLPRETALVQSFLLSI